MNLICDYRETHAIQQFNKIIENNKDKYENIKISNSNLALGDFQIGNMLFERKTHKDLASSILDGRYQEQSNRLIEHGKNNSNIKIIYIIEGNLDLYFNQHNINKDKIISCVMSLMYEKGFQVLLTKHLNETCEYLIKFCLKYYTKYHEQIGGNHHHEIMIQPKKKASQIQKTNIGIMMLCNVPHISVHVASQLLEPFDNNLTNFLIKIKENNEYLKNIKIKTKENKERKLAKNIRETLIEYFG